MTTTYHTPITIGAAGNSAIVNAPLGQIDTQLVAITPTTAEVVTARGVYATLNDRLAAITVSGSASAEVIAARGGYPDLDSRLDAMVLGSGIVDTQANGAANAGQKVVTVDSSTGFLAGAYVAYELVGGTIEYNSIATVDSPTQITLDTNIGTGGIPNNGYIQVVSIQDYYGDVSFNSLFVGDGTPSGNDSAIILGRSLTGSVNIEGFRDESAVASTGALSMYNSYDAVPTISGAATHDHYHGFQSRPIYGSSGAITRLASFWSLPVVNGPVTNLYHLHINAPTGAGAVTVQAGIRIEELTQGATNYGVYQLGASMVNYFQGAVQSSGRVFTSGSMDAATLGVGAQNGGNGIIEISASGTGARRYGMVSVFSYTGTQDPYGAYFSASVENGKTTGGTSVYGGLMLAAMTGLASNCYSSATYGGHYQLSFNAGSTFTVTALIANSLHIAAPGITGAGTIAIGSLAGLNVENQGTVKATASYGVKIADQSGSGTNYALHTGAGLVLFNSGGDAASDFIVKSDSYDALIVDASENSIALMNHASGKIGFYGTTPIAKALLATGAGATVDNVITALQNLGLVKQS